MDRCGVCRDVAAVPVCYGEEGAEAKGKALDLLVGLCSCPHLCLQVLRGDCKNEIMDTSG